MTNFKTGIISANVGAFSVVEFADLDGMKTKPIPVTQASTGLDKSFRMPKVGDHVAVLMDEHMEDGVVLGSIYSDPEPPPVTGDKLHFTHEDGTVIEYDGATHQVQMSMAGCSFKLTPSGVYITVGGCAFAFSSSGLQVTGGDVKADTISLKSHKSTLVQPGSGQSGVPI